MNCTRALAGDLGVTISRWFVLLVIFSGCLSIRYIRAQELTAAQLDEAEKAFEDEKQRLLEELTTHSFLESVRVRAVRQPFTPAEERRSEDGLLDTELEVAYADHKIWSVKEQRDLTLRHRCYEGAMVGPTIRVRPGDNLRVLMKNRLPFPKVMDGHEEDDGDHGNHLSPLRFNTTNLHTHGLHVSPSGNADNVLVHIGPEDEFQNEIYIPGDHPAGTFWYHAHVHGSTAIQVSSGMAGALIVEGGIDTVPEIAAAKEDILLFQQITHHPPASMEGEEVEPDTVVVEDFEGVMGPGKWAPGVLEGRWRTTINGQAIPIFRMQPGEVRRWRLIHGGVRETIDLELEGHEFVELAADGLAYGKKVVREFVRLQPGYRSDVLVRANSLPDGEPVTTFLIDRRTSGADSLLAEPEPPNVLAIVVISGEEMDMPFPEDEALAPFKPFDSIQDEELEEEVEKVEFNIAGGGGQPLLFQIDGKSFDPGEEPRKLKLGTASEWELTSKRASHPFHIHVNPFEIVEMLNSDGQNVLEEPIWKDTIFVQSVWKVRIRSRYQRYIGTFVLHCHILDHEDQGMMQLVEIEP